MKKDIPVYDGEIRWNWSIHEPKFELIDIEFINNERQKVLQTQTKVPFVRCRQLETKSLEEQTKKMEDKLSELKKQIEEQKKMKSEM